VAPSRAYRHDLTRNSREIYANLELMYSSALFRRSTLARSPRRGSLLLTFSAVLTLLLCMGGSDCPHFSTVCEREDLLALSNFRTLILANDSTSNHSALLAHRYAQKLDCLGLPRPFQSPELRRQLRPVSHVGRAVTLRSRDREENRHHQNSHVLPKSFVRLQCATSTSSRGHREDLKI